MRALRLLLLSLVLLGAAPASFTPYLVRDINLGVAPASSNPAGFVTLGGLALFQVSDNQVSVEDHRGLWRSDGTASGTYRLLATGQVQIVAVTGDRCFFSFQADDHLWYLGVTDGTLPGTFSLAKTGARWPASVWVPRQRVLYFSSEIPGSGHGVELWRSDGTPGGTYEVLDIEPGPGSSSPTDLTSFRGRLYFAAGSALWQSDGTAAGTVQVRDVPAASLRVVGSLLVFVGADSRGSELWASDGTPAGTRRIADLTPGVGSTSFYSFQVAGTRLFFTASAGARGEELYVTDGTAQGTRRLTWLAAPDAIYPDWVPLGNRLLFWADDSAHGVELWSSDGTTKGTRMVLDACPGACSSYASPLLPFQGRIYFGSQVGGRGAQLWVTDGTAQGTRMVKDVPGAAESWPQRMGTSGDRMFFVTHGWDWSSTGLWATDGTADGTVPLAEIYDFDLTLDGAVAGGALLFSGEGDDGDVELWRSDGTPAGTHLLVDIADEDLGGSSPHGLMTLGQNVLFFAQDENGYALWRSDGTEAGTTAVKRGLGGRTVWTASATRVFFEPTQARRSLWTSDGTEAGTVRLTPPGVRVQGALSAPVIKLGSRVFFAAWSPPSGTEPWVTDGTPKGTRLLADLSPGREGSSPRDFTVFAGRAWFVAGLHLWRSDGTSQGTVAVGPELQDLHPRTTYGGRLWFTGVRDGLTELWATDGTAARTERIAALGTIESLTTHAGRLWFLGNGSELWSTDGTAAGTRKLVGLPASSFRLLLSDGARLYLSDSYSALWVSDGTTAGTRRISDAGPQNGPWIAFAGRLYYVSSAGSLYTSDGTAAGTRPVRPDGEPREAATLLRFGDRLVVVAHGKLWRSDGTAEGTQWIRDVSWTYAGAWEIAKAGPRLFFASWDAETGTELWAMQE